MIDSSKFLQDFIKLPLVFSKSKILADLLWLIFWLISISKPLTILIDFSK